jgi:hypothetical protein
MLHWYRVADEVKGQKEIIVLDCDHGCARRLYMSGRQTGPGTGFVARLVPVAVFGNVCRCWRRLAGRHAMVCTGTDGANVPILTETENACRASGRSGARLASGVFRRVTGNATRYP